MMPARIPEAPQKTKMSDKGFIVRESNRNALLPVDSAFGFARKVARLDLCACARDRELVLRPSTSTKIRNLLAAVEHRLLPTAIEFPGLAVDFFDLLPLPSHAGDFNVSILRHPENGRHVG